MKRGKTLQNISLKEKQTKDFQSTSMFHINEPFEPRNASYY